MRRRLAARLAGAAALLALAAPLRAAGGEPLREPAEIAVLSYNVHGLPAWIAGDDPPARLPVILAAAERYDVVLLQEDFAYHGIVADQHRHAVLVRGNGPRFDLPIFQGAGLTLLARAAEPRVRYAEPYGVCHGWLGAANDCFGHKGLLMARLVLANGAAIDVWNTHLDAGFGDGDHAAREQQLALLASAIETRSDGRAVVAGGDFNLAWDEPRDRALLEAFAARLGLGIAAMTPEGAWAERLDYLLVRSGERAALEVLEGGMAHRLVDSAGGPLSDHPAVFARLRVR